MPNFNEKREEIKAETVKYFLGTLKNLKTPHPKLLVVFAGTPCSGKSRIAEDLERSFNGVRVRSDVPSLYMYDHFKNYEGSDVLAIEALKGEIVAETMEAIKNEPNGFVILDKGIERTYSAMGKWASDNGYPVFSIKVEADGKSIEKCLSQKEEHNEEYYRDNMPYWEKQFHDFADSFLFDYEFKTSENYDLQLTELLEILGVRDS